MRLVKAARERHSPQCSKITEIKYVWWNFASTPLIAR
jgi:hypothetical protein